MLLVEELKADKAFISYSWAMPGREERVLGLAKRLMDDGVEVVLDKWDRTEDQNSNHFI